MLKHPEIYDRILDEGHTIGNHTYNHLNGWTTENIKYFHNIRRCAHLVNSDLFRPPYGRIKPKQAQFIQRHYDIIMWSLLSGDFDPALSKEMCLQNVVSNIQPGAIIVFHDSLKAFEKLKYVLPKTLDNLKLMGFTSDRIVSTRKEQTIIKTA